MSVLDQIKAHFEKELDDMRPIQPVPEWGPAGQPLEIFIRPITLEEQDQIRPYYGTNDALVMTLIMRARDAKGKRLFTKPDRIEIKQWADPRVLERVIIDMSKAFAKPAPVAAGPDPEADKAAKAALEEDAKNS